MNNIVITSILSMAGLGLCFASLLAVVNKKLKVEENPLVEKITETLPGVNCGACGFTGCHQYAEALAKKEVSPDLCKAGGEQTAAKLSAILGIELGKKVKEVAVCHCGADNTLRKKKAVYAGIKTCQAAHNLFGGEDLCLYGCLGYGDCLKACPFGAIEIVKGLPRINKDKCVACGKCVAACPRKLITIEKADSADLLYVACSNKDKGQETRKTCQVGCIACGVCQKLTGGAFVVENNLARALPEKVKDIKNAKEVADKCPAKCIAKI